MYYNLYKDEKSQLEVGYFFFLHEKRAGLKVAHKYKKRTISMVYDCQEYNLICTLFHQNAVYTFSIRVFGMKLTKHVYWGYGGRWQPVTWWVS